MCVYVYIYTYTLYTYTQCGYIPLLTCVLPPELSCTAVLDSAVLAAKDLKVAPNMLLTPNAMSSCNKINHRFRKTYLGLKFYPFWLRFPFGRQISAFAWSHLFPHFNLIF